MVIECKCYGNISALGCKCYCIISALGYSNTHPSTHEAINQTVCGVFSSPSSEGGMSTHCGLLRACHGLEG